jgi:hypothetical protein
MIGTTVGLGWRSQTVTRYVLATILTTAGPQLLLLWTDCPTGKSLCRNVLAQLACQAPFAKIFCFTEYSDYPILPPSRPTKGALRNVNNAGRDAVDAEGVSDEGA